MNAAETARKALAILERDGWCKFATEWTTMHRTAYPDASYPLGSHCLGGAWNEAMGPLTVGQLQESYKPLAALISEQYPEFRTAVNDIYPWNIIPLMNDTDTTIEADVRAILEKLAAGDA